MAQRGHTDHFCSRQRPQVEEHGTYSRSVSKTEVVSGKADIRGRCYVALGTDPSASDQNIVFAYRRQADRDPARQAWYLTFLEQIANIRESDEIHVEIGLQKSLGRFDLDQVKAAYLYFGFQDDNVDEEYILGTYRSRLLDAPRQYMEMREQLLILGQHRHSTNIIETANGSKSQNFLEDAKDSADLTKVWKLTSRL